MQGSFVAFGTGTQSGTLHGCDIAVEPPWPACTETFSQEYQGGPSVFVQADPSANTATLSWPLPPMSGVQGINTCRGGSFFGQDPVSLPTSTVPFAGLAGGAPQTLSFTRTRNAPSGPQANVASTVSVEITVQRVREDGSPL